MDCNMGPKRNAKMGHSIVSQRDPIINPSNK